uniref:Uncharacterized protein n=1 Tax=Rhizophora mucronata TaxID=61149 RepID=A0A2P2NVD7_RHIMU
MTSQTHHFKSIINYCYHTRPLVSQLKSQLLIQFSGPDTNKYLQGLLTNYV